MEGGIDDGEFHSLIGGFHWQVGAFGVAQVAEIKFLCDRGCKVAGLLSFQTGKGVFAGNIMGAVAIGTIGMPRGCRICLGQHFP